MISLKYVVKRTNASTLKYDYYIGLGQFLPDINKAKRYNTKQECPYYGVGSISDKTLCGKVIEKHIFEVIEI